jgi:chromosome condensin MukBEF complex kleisin-like MukF subunit
MIVRVMGEGQWRVADDLQQRLNELDEEVARAVEAGDEETMRAKLRELADAVKSNGEKLPDEDLHPSDAIVPPDDLSLDEAKELLSDEGLIPDLPVGGGSS